MYPVYMSERGGGDGEVTYSETSSLLSYTRRYVSFTEVGNVCRVALREPMYLCTSMSEGGDGEAVLSETSSLLSYILRCVSEEGGDGEAAHSETSSLLSLM
jgi:hypothetical protein